MSDKKPLFKYVDEQVFKQIDNLKQSQPYQEVMRQLNGLNDFQLKAVNQAASILVISIPLIIFIVFVFINISFKVIFCSFILTCLQLEARNSKLVTIPTVS